MRVLENTGKDGFNEHVFPVDVGGEGFPVLVSADNYIKVGVNGLGKTIAQLESSRPNQACHGWEFGQCSLGAAHPDFVMGSSIGPTDLCE